MTHWFYLANVKYFDVLGSFEAGVHYWPVKTKAAAGDILYVYLAEPYKQIAFECEIVRTGIEQEEVFAHVLPFIKCETPDKMDKKFMELKIQKSVPLTKDSPLGYSYLKEMGLKGRLLWPRNLDNCPELLSYIKAQI